MRKLHLVGLTTDRDGLIFTARKGSKSGGFIVPLDERVLNALTEARNASNGAPAEPAATGPDVEAVPKRLRSESALTPREMQARLRAGRTIEEVAAEAGVDTEWVARFAVPILAEQAQVVELARALVYAKPRLGESTQALGISVLQNLSDRGVFLPDDVANAAWSAFQLHDSVWMVRFRYRARGRDQEAQWEIDVPAGRLRARNRHASDLGYVDPDRWRSAPEPDDLPDVDATTPAPSPGRRSTSTRAAKPQPMAKAVAAAKRKTAAAPPARAAAKTRATKTTKTTTKATKATKTTKATKAPRTAKAGAPRAAKSSRATTAAKVAPRTASARTPAKRRTAKAVPAPETGPTAGSGGVRMAVARVSTARVAASLATADREPWAAAVRRPGRTQGSAIPGSGTGRSRPAPPAPEPVRAFQPRPLPAPGREPPPSATRVRKVAVPRPQAGDTPAVSLPAPRVPAPRQQQIPVERAKRRRLRPR